MDWLGGKVGTNWLGGGQSTRGAGREADDAGQNYYRGEITTHAGLSLSHRLQLGRSPDDGRR